MAPLRAVAFSGAVEAGGVDGTCTKNRDVHLAQKEKLKKTKRGEELDFKSSDTELTRV